MTRRYPSNLVKYEMCNKQAETAFQILSVVDRRPIIKLLTNTIVDSDQCADQTSQCKHTTSIKLYNQHKTIQPAYDYKGRSEGCFITPRHLKIQQQIIIALHLYVNLTRTTSEVNLSLSVRVGAAP